MKAMELKNLMKVHSDDFYSNTCYKLSAEIIRKLMNSKIDDFTKMTLLKQYMKDLISNDIMLEKIKDINK